MQRPAPASPALPCSSLSTPPLKPWPTGPGTPLPATFVSVPQEGGVEAGVAGLRRGQKHESGPLPSGKEYESPKRFERIDMSHTTNEVTRPHPCNPVNRSLADSDCAELGSMTVLRGWLISAAEPGSPMAALRAQPDHCSPPHSADHWYRSGSHHAPTRCVAGPAPDRARRSGPG